MIKSHIFSQEQYLFSYREIQSLLTEPHTGFQVDESLASVRAISPAEEQALFDIKYYLPDDLLVKVDRASMQHSLEVRVPILDHRIAEFALNLKQQHKYNRSISKYILKKFSLIMCQSNYLIGQNKVFQYLWPNG